MYWANQFAPERFSFANLDGTPGGNLSTAGASIGEPRGLAMDVAAGRVYWTKRGTGPADGRISFANLDGSGSGGDLNTSGATVNLPNAAAVYPAGGRSTGPTRGATRSPTRTSTTRVAAIWPSPARR